MLIVLLSVGLDILIHVDSGYRIIVTKGSSILVLNVLEIYHMHIKKIMYIYMYCTLNYLKNSRGV